jgi:hypothetical protein
MTPEEFHVIATLISSREPAKSAARRVLVDGIAPADAAREVELVPQSVSNTLRRIRAAEATILTAYKPVKKNLKSV